MSLPSRLTPQDPTGGRHVPAEVSSTEEATPTKRLDGLDVLRALAILAVLCFHAPASVMDALSIPLRIAFAHGWMGVDLFFVLSGYLIGRQVFGPLEGTDVGGQLRSFWAKRWMRTLPLYYTVLAVYVLKPWLLGTPFVGGSWTYALFLQNYAEPRDFVQSWSLCVEEHFYLLLPLLAFGLNGRRWPAVAWLLPVGVSLIARWLVSRGLPLETPLPLRSTLLQWPTHQHLDGLAVGVFLAKTAPTWRSWSSARRVACGVLGLGMLGITLHLGGPLLPGASGVWLFTGLATGFGLVLVGIESLRLPSVPRWSIQQVATLSYGAYLWHGLVVRLFEGLRWTSGLWGLDLMAFVALTLAVSWVTHVAVEKPCLRLRNRLLGMWNSGGERLAAVHGQRAGP